MQVKNLTKQYGSLTAVDHVDMEIPEGICFGLLGPNGAGKTTTIEMMEGILAPTEGEILFRGNPINRHFREKVGIQFQNTALPEFITVKETLEMFQAFYPHPRSMDELIEICALQDILERDNRKLSGGQRQRMLLGLAIIPRPEIIFLDEPTTGLDPQARRNFWNLIDKIKGENTTIVLTTHYMDEAKILCDQIAIMDHGKIIEWDTPDSLIKKHFEGVLVRVPRENNTGICLDNAVERNNHLEIQTSNLHETMEDLLKCRYNLTGMSIHEPNLEDLFLKLTGSSLRS